MAPGMCWECGRSRFRFRHMARRWPWRMCTTQPLASGNAGAPRLRNEARGTPWHICQKLLRRGCGQQRAAMVELVADQGEAKDAALKPVGEPAEQRRFPLVFKQVELA